MTVLSAPRASRVTTLKRTAVVLALMAYGAHKLYLWCASAWLMRALKRGRWMGSPHQASPVPPWPQRPKAGVNQVFLQRSCDSAAAIPRILCRETGLLSARPPW